MIIEKVLENAIRTDNFSRVMDEIVKLGPEIYINSHNRSVRILSQKEIKDSVTWLDFDFGSLGIIPLFDIQDNNYIGYCEEKNKYIIINVIDEIVYEEGTLSQLLASLG